MMFSTISPATQNTIHSTPNPSTASNLTQTPSETALQKLFAQQDKDVLASDLRSYRLCGSTELESKLAQALSTLSQQEKENEPLLHLLEMTLHQSGDLEKRKQLAESVASHPAENRFEASSYAYLASPHLLLAHMLITANWWVCANQTNKEFYDEQMAGMFFGTVAFDQGDVLTELELKQIQAKEDPNTRYPIADSLTPMPANSSPLSQTVYKVSKWCSTPAMKQTGEARLDELFITQRREQQKSITDQYFKKLQETSPLIKQKFQLNDNEAVAVIGPYSAGKTSFVKKKLDTTQYTQFGLDHLAPMLHTNPKASHFEAMMLKDGLFKRAKQVNCLLTEVAAIDPYRFNTLIRQFSDRKKLHIIEIQPSCTLNQLLQSAKTYSQADLGAVETSFNDANQSRSQRQKIATENPQLSYQLLTASFT